MLNCLCQYNSATNQKRCRMRVKSYKKIDKWPTYICLIILMLMTGCSKENNFCITGETYCPELSQYIYEIENEIGLKIEHVFRSFDGVSRINMICGGEQCSFEVYFQPEISVDVAFENVRKKLLEISKTFPANTIVRNIKVSKSLEKQTQIMRGIFYSKNVELNDLWEEANEFINRIADESSKFLTVKPAGEMDTHIMIDPDRMARFGLSLGDVIERIKNVDTDNHDVWGEISIADEGKGGPLLLKDIATFEKAYYGPIQKYNGIPCVEFNFYAPLNKKTVAIEYLNKVIKKYEKSFLRSIHVQFTNNTAFEKTRLQLSFDPMTFNQTPKPLIDDFLEGQQFIQKLQSVNGVESIFSTIKEGEATIELSFNLDISYEQAISQVRNSGVSLSMPVLVLPAQFLNSSLQTQLKVVEIPLTIEPYPLQLITNVFVQGNDISLLHSESWKIQTDLKQIPGVGSIRTSDLDVVTEPILTLNSHKLKVYGISAQSVELWRKFLTNRLTITTAFGIVKIKNKNSNPNSFLENIRIKNHSDHLIPLREVVSMKQISDQKQIHRIDGVRCVELNIYSDGTSRPKVVINQIRKKLNTQLNKIDGITVGMK